MKESIRERQMSYRNYKDLEKELKRILKIIIKKYQPEKIILFGSLANNNIHEGSDIDLIVIKESSKRYFDRVDELIHLIHPREALDLFVLTPQEVQGALDEENPYYEEIINKGEVLYEKTGSSMA